MIFNLCHNATNEEQFVNNLSCEQPHHNRIPHPRYAT